MNTFQLSVQKLKLPKIISTLSEGIRVLAFNQFWLLEQNLVTVSVVQIHEVLTFSVFYERKKKTELNNPTLDTQVLIFQMH